MSPAASLLTTILLYVLFVFVCFGLEDGPANGSHRIVLAYVANKKRNGLDFRSAINVNTTMAAKIRRKYFEFHNLLSYSPRDALRLMQRAHVFTWANNYPVAMRKLKEIGYNATSALNYHSIIPSDQSDIIAMFNNKKAWREWMRDEVGLGSFIGQEYPLDGPKEYPLLFKLSEVHSGNGVFIVRNETELNKLVAQHPYGTYFLEEALTGIADAEVTIWGSAYRGKLLSLRCGFKTLQYKSNEDVYVAGSNMQHNKLLLKYTICGRTITSQMKAIFQAAMYSGEFGINAKHDRHMRIKYMELNGRICGEFINSANLFLSTYVPLVFAVQADKIIRGEWLAPSSHVPDPGEAVFARLDKLRAQEEDHLNVVGVSIPDLNHSLYYGTNFNAYFGVSAQNFL